MRLRDKVAIVTGGARGMGSAESIMFANEGAKVVIADIRREMGEDVAHKIRKNGGTAEFIWLDVTSEEQWKSLLVQTISLYGKLDILVNNAGITGHDSVISTSEEQWDQIMDVNAKGIFFGCKHSIPYMIKNGKGSIINISSQMGLVGSAIGSPAYNASKGAVTIFTKSAALRHAKDNIRINSVHPGPIDTPMLKESSLKRSDKSKTVLDPTPMGRQGTPDEVAFGVLFLASDESSYVTGSELVIDGGYLAE